MPGNAAFASCHPCYAFPGYECDCGVKSRTIEEHREHVKTKHDLEYAKKVCSVADMEKIYGPEWRNLKTIYYCKCGQAVRFRKRDKKWVHQGYNRIHESYEDFLKRTNHPVEIADKKLWLKR